MLRLSLSSAYSKVENVILIVAPKPAEMYMIFLNIIFDRKLNMIYFRGNRLRASTLQLAGNIKHFWLGNGVFYVLVRISKIIR